MSVPVHGIISNDSVAGAGVQVAEHWFQDVWWFHSINVQNEDVAAGEPGMILLQFGTDTWDANREWHAVEMGNVRAGAPMVYNLGFPMREVLVVAHVDHVAAASHRLTVLAWKVQR